MKVFFALVIVAVVAISVVGKSVTDLGTAVAEQRQAQIEQVIGE